MAGSRDHFNVLIVCALELELQAAKGVLENETGSKFENKYTAPPELASLNVRVCEQWNSTDMKVGMVALTKMGGIEAQRVLSSLAKYFTSNVVVMTGICAGEEDVYGHVEHGSVVVADRTAVKMGGKVQEDGDYLPLADYCETDKGILASARQLVEEGQSSVWWTYIPKDAIRPSPRYLKQLILDLAIKSRQDGITKGKLLNKLVEMELPGMTTMEESRVRLAYDQVLSIMLQQEPPWVAGPNSKYRYVATKEGEGYKVNEAVFPRPDELTATVGAIMTVSDVHLDLKQELKTMKKDMAQRKGKAVDMEAHMFMKQSIESFGEEGRPGKAVVMKGISDFGSKESKVDYYQVYAASTSAAFLRHLITEKPHLFDDEKSPGDRLEPAPMDRIPSPALPDDEIEALVTVKGVETVRDAILDRVAGRYFEIGIELGMNHDQIGSATNALANDRSKLLVIITMAGDMSGKKKGIIRVLQACRKMRVIGGIVDSLSELNVL